MLCGIRRVVVGRLLGRLAEQPQYVFSQHAGSRRSCARSVLDGVEFRFSNQKTRALCRSVGAAVIELARVERCRNSGSVRQPLNVGRRSHNVGVTNALPSAAAREVRRTGNRCSLQSSSCTSGCTCHARLGCRRIPSRQPCHRQPRTVIRDPRTIAARVRTSERRSDGPRRSERHARAWVHLPQQALPGRTQHRGAPLTANTAMRHGGELTLRESTGIKHGHGRRRRRD